MKPERRPAALHVCVVGIIVIGASAGGFKPLRRIVGALPIPCAAAIFVVLHIGPNRSNLPVLLDRAGMPAVFAQDEALIQVGHLYVAPPDHHMTLADGQYPTEPRAEDPLYAPGHRDPLFRSAADAYGTDVMGIVLSGGGEDWRIWAAGHQGAWWYRSRATAR